jgi:hypothetical protein
MPGAARWKQKAPSAEWNALRAVDFMPGLKPRPTKLAQPESSKRENRCRRFGTTL